MGNLTFEKALCDLGASINLMPLSIFRQLGIGDVKPTMISLQLKVDKFIFPADFIILDIEEDRDIPLILGRPFLGIGRALIDVQQGELML